MRRKDQFLSVDVVFSVASMEKQQRFCVSSPRFSAKKIQNSNKRKERGHQEAESEVLPGYGRNQAAQLEVNSAGRDSRSYEVVLLGLLPPFSENPSWVKKPETSATVSAIADSRIPGRVSKELKLFDDSQEFFWS
ncbi:hypothetical protein POTOM_003832 [Populus tomentosa]|uniref:Uncharacterized protein n=1 Tax=Populus tomentosa TaxID=118781 RepID=A0A8X8AJ99_POPTO|nr:hypothetical protein POTOM_003832 [Populus tomentosa]